MAYDRGITDFCASCHTEYVRTIGNTPLGEVYDAGDTKGAVARFRHPVSNKAGWNSSLPGPLDSKGNPVKDQNGNVITGNWDTSLQYLATNSWVPAVAPGPQATTGKALRRVGGDITTVATNQFNDGQNVTCLTCHFAHGSSAAATNQAANVLPTSDSALLYLNNRGVCQDCHGKTN